MDKLSLPTYNFNIKDFEGKTVIFDIIRKKYLVLTPEEWVRQHFIHYLINQLGYAKSLISVEHGLKYNSLLKRTDIIVYSNTAEPLVLIECKAPEHRLNKKVLEQAMMYNKTVQAEYIIVTNGLEHSCLRIDRVNKRVDYLNTIPFYHDISQ